MKKCYKCKEYKDYSNFSIDNRSKDGYQSTCKKCINNYYELNKEKIKNRSKKYRKDHKDEIKEKDKKHYIKNKEKIKIINNKYRKNNKEKLNIANKLRQNTKSGKFKSYISHSKIKDRTFELSFEEFLIFWQEPCFYCGSEILTIGLDRLDNLKGYIKDNVKSCCFICNRMKNNLSFCEWIKYIEQINFFKNYGFNRNIILTLSRQKSNIVQYGDYKYKSNRRNIIFELSFEEFVSFYKIPCHYCGTIVENRIGIDRTNNNGGYIINNVVSCCKTCNYGKNNLEYENFQQHLIKLISRIDIIKELGDIYNG